ncbi:MAG: serine/threonine-protein kinase [Acidobacteria bacterium]|nr:serine/threonine-protein kinase [Acidobacteriota bacterium]
METAHENGVIHRDLKPANIHLGPDGRVKVLDFGLAKAFEPDASSPALSLSPTLTTPATRAGVIMGTAAYMSPEQAKGKPVDRRADIWAFGCVLYEMLAGRRPFVGDGVSELIAAVIMGPPNLEAIPSGVPSSIRSLIRRCLDKDPKRRLRDIGDARLVIEETLAGAPDERAGGPVAAGAAAGVDGTKTAVGPILVAGLIAGALAGAGILWVLRSPAAPAPLRRFELSSKGPFRSALLGSLVAISPDGRRVAYSEAGGLFIRELDHLEPKQVKVAAAPGFLFWSPDSAWLAYQAGGKIWKVPAGGGESQVVVDHPGLLTGGSGASWGPNDRIVYAGGEDAIDEVPATGGDIKKLVANDPNEKGDFHDPSWLPDGSGVLFVRHAPGGPPNDLSLVAGGARKSLLKLDDQQIWYPVYSPTGHILYRRQPNNPGIWALPFSLSKHAATGEPFLVVPDGDLPSVSNDGTLVTVKGAGGGESQLVWLDRSGKLTGTIGKPQAQWPFPAISPDGRQIAIAATENDKREIWLHDAERGTMTRLTSNSAGTWSPVWTPKGDQVVYTDGQAPPALSILVKAADGSGEAKKLVDGWGPSISPDGRYLAYAASDPNNDWDLWYLELEKGGPPVLLLKAPETQIWPRISPDGAFYAYQSGETGRNEVYVKRFPSGEGKWQVSTDGGEWPAWGHHGDRIYYVHEDTILEARFASKPGVSLGRPVEILTRPSYGAPLMFGWTSGFDVSADDQRFVVARAVGGTQVASGIIVIENWLAEFRKK